MYIHIVPPNLDGFMTVIAGLHDSSFPSAPAAVRIRTSEPPRRLEPFRRLDCITWCRHTVSYCSILLYMIDFTI